jgi:transcriptional regulator with XRE-family HTH domain
MKSPLTGKEIRLQIEERNLSFRKEEFPVQYHYYLCEDSNEQFTTPELDELNIIQVHNLYRKKHNLPFPDELKLIREKYAISAVKMAEVLGFGINMYRAYENGEIPSDSNARLIQLASDPEELKKLVILSNVFEGKDKEKVLRKIDELIEDKNAIILYDQVSFLMGSSRPDEFNGFKKPDLEKYLHVLVHFAVNIRPMKTKLNKLMFYTDFLHYKNHCISITGSQYRALPYGPVPANYSSLIEYAESYGYIKTEYKWIIRNNEDVLSEIYHPGLRTFDPELFTEVELQTLNKVCDLFKNSNTAQIVNKSHEEIGWKKNIAQQELINYNYGFELTI